MNKAYLLIGGNIGDRRHYLAKARDFIEKNCGMLSNQSPIYETAAWGLQTQAPFLNQALELKTVLSPNQLLTALLKIERDAGREREIKYGPRTIDIDILLYNDEIISTDDLSVPHPQLQNRRFALAPLVEIAGDKIHPVLKKTIKQLLSNCKDPLQVLKIDY